MDFIDRIVLYSSSLESLSNNELGWTNPKLLRMGDQRFPAISGVRGPPQSKMLTVKTEDFPSSRKGIDNSPDAAIKLSP
jgi:hypothetical protein